MGFSCPGTCRSAASKYCCIGHIANFHMQSPFTEVVPLMLAMPPGSYFSHSKTTVLFTCMEEGRYFKIAVKNHTNKLNIASRVPRPQTIFQSLFFLLIGRRDILRVAFPPHAYLQ